MHIKLMYSVACLFVALFCHSNPVDLFWTHDKTSFESCFSQISPEEWEIIQHSNKFVREDQIIFKQRDLDHNYRDSLCWIFGKFLNLEKSLVPTCHLLIEEKISRIAQPLLPLICPSPYGSNPCSVVSTEFEDLVTLENYWNTCLTIYLLNIYDIDNRNYGILDDRIILFDNEHSLYSHKPICVLQHINDHLSFLSIGFPCISTLFDWKMADEPIGEELALKLMHFVKTLKQNYFIHISTLSPKPPLQWTNDLWERIHKIDCFSKWNANLSWNTLLRYLYPEIPPKEELEKLAKIINQIECNVGNYGALLWCCFRRNLLHPSLWEELSKDIDLWLIKNIPICSEM